MTDSAPVEQPRSIFDAIRLKEFRLFVINRFFFTMSMRMIITVVAWRMYLLTKNPLALAFIGLSEAIPAILMALYSGHIVDKSDKRALISRLIFLYMICAGALFYVIVPATELRHGKEFVQYAVYGAMFCTGVLRSFIGPSTSSILAQLVPRAVLPTAVTWSSGTYLTASVIGHGSAGFLIAYAGYQVTFILILCYMSVSFVCMRLIQPKPVANTRSEQKAWDSVKEGLKYVFSTKELLGAQALDMLAVLFGGAVAMIPFFAGEILHVGSVGFGWLNAASDIGSITAILLMTIFPLKRKQGRTLMFAVAGFGLCIITFGLSKIFILSFFALLISGALDGISVVVRGTILQLKTPDHMRGRVSSVNSMFINSSNEIGYFESGVVAKLMGVVNSVVFGGTMTLLVVGIMWFKAPSLRKFEY